MYWSAHTETHLCIGLDSPIVVITDPQTTVFNSAGRVRVSQAEDSPASTPLVLQVELTLGTSLGLSLVSPRKGELAYLKCEEIQAQVTIVNGAWTATASMERLQLDNQLPEVFYVGSLGFAYIMWFLVNILFRW